MPSTTTTCVPVCREHDVGCVLPCLVLPGVQIRGVHTRWSVCAMYVDGYIRHYIFVAAVEVIKKLPMEASL